MDAEEVTTGKQVESQKEISAEEKAEEEKEEAEEVTSRGKRGRN